MNNLTMGNSKTFNRIHADNNDDIVVFLIGMRFNALWKIHRWLPVIRAMPKMLRELYSTPELGFLHGETWFGRTIIMVQYWNSKEQLKEYALSDSLEHLPAWKEFNKNTRASNAVGIWHETYSVKAEDYESIYINMPLFGLAKAKGKN